MPVIISRKINYVGSVNVSQLDQEVTVVDIPGNEDDYMVEGYVDLSSLQQDDVLIVTEYMSVDGANLKPFAQYSFSGPLPAPIYRFHTKTLYRSMTYRVTVRLVTGSVPKTVPYAFIVEVLGTV
ncbi:MAG: hypothetical protein ACO2PN_11225 [Pyrobaculum sp.]